MSRLEFGFKCRDIITGREGILTDRIMHMTGCDRLGITDEKGETKMCSDKVIKVINSGVEDELVDCNKFDDIMKSKYHFRDTLRDSISKYEGKVVAIQIGISGDISYALTPVYDKNAKDNDAVWYDEGRLVLIAPAQDIVDKYLEEHKDNKARTGGDPNPLGLSIR